ncbi:MAG: phosphoribosylamine--glycine ligase [Treponema sp.]|nr:phosphoribosylamine--glycine ligase [Treponema sp.]
MKVLVIGSGGREHAIIKALKKNRRISQLYAAPGNGGIGRDAQNAPVKSTDIPAMLEFTLKNKIDYIVVAPDDPLAAGTVDALEEKKIRCFGPNKAAARIESSKIFAKELMKKYGIPTASYEIFSDADKAADYVKQDNVSFPLVIKADGLALGKGVIIAADTDEALNAINAVMCEKKFGSSGNSIVIEEYLAGNEVSVLAFTDGKNIKPVVSSMDHKRAFDGNKGPNTGGMGVIAPNPHYTKEIELLCNEKIFLPTIRAMRKEGCPFKGCLYFGLMLTPRGPMVIEYNCRFGDPETQVILPLLETDLLEIMEAVTDEKLADINISWTDNHAACVILASGGYPSSYKTGYVIDGLNETGSSKNGDAIIYHGGTEYKDGAFFTAGGRVLGVTAIAQSLEDALKIAYNNVNAIDFKDMFCRRDIGKY